MFCSTLCRTLLFFRNATQCLSMTSSCQYGWTILKYSLLLTHTLNPCKCLCATHHTRQVDLIIIDMYVYCLASGFVFGPEHVALCWQKIFSITSEFIKFGCIGWSSQYNLHKRLNPLIQYRISVKNSLVMKLFWPLVLCFSQKLHQFSKNCQQDSRVARRPCVDVMERGLRNISISLDIWFNSSMQGFKCLDVQWFGVLLHK